MERVASIEAEGSTAVDISRRVKVEQVSICDMQSFFWLRGVISLHVSKHK